MAENIVTETPNTFWWSRLYVLKYDKTKKLQIMNTDPTISPISNPP